MMISKTTFVSGAQVTLPYGCRLRFEFSAPTPQSTIRRQDPQKSATRDRQTRLSGTQIASSLETFGTCPRARKNKNEK